MRPYFWGIVWLVVVTLVYSGSDAGRAALVMPLFNHILLRNSSATETPKDREIARKVTEKCEREVDDAKREATRLDLIPDESVLETEDLGLGKPLVRRDTPDEVRDDEVVQLVARTRDQLDAAAKQVIDPTQGSFFENLKKKINISGAWVGWEPFSLDKDKRRDERRVGKVLKAIALQRAAVERLGSDPTHKDAAARFVAAGLSLEARRLATDAMFLGLWNELIWIFAAAIIFAFLIATFHFLMFYVSRALVTKMVVDIQNKLAEHLLTLSIRYFNEERRGELFSRLTTDLSNTHSVLMLVLSDVLIQPLRLLVLASMASWVSWQLAISLVVLAFTVIIPVKIWGKKIRRSARERQASLANVFESMQQMFGGIRIVKAFRREPYEMERFRHRTDEYLVSALKVVRDRTASKSWMELMNDLTIPIVLLAGGYVVINHQFGLDVGRFGAFLTLVVLMYMPAKVLASSYNTLQDSLPSVDRILEVLDSRAEIVDAKDATELGKLSSTIRFEDVTFGYIEGKDVLKNISFTAKVGEVTAIVGPTTAGKSTLVDLIARFYDPGSGRVTVDGTDLRNVKLASLLDKIAVVTQDPFLFNDTIRENIRYGRLDATDAEIEAAAKAAKIHDDIVAMPQGYLSNVGERGAKLSGGQRQRLTIARAILKNPEILILDEATSSLDATTERRVQEALEELEHGRTTFVIAHRLSTVQHAHKILVLYEGRLVEEGRHEELVGKGGLYASLVKDLAMSNGNGNGHAAAPSASTLASTN
jgi:subfamily B ATP-binding cassette protein MsbA